LGFSWAKQQTLNAINTISASWLRLGVLTGPP
jgi:hypothetical protein